MVLGKTDCITGCCSAWIPARGRESLHCSSGCRSGRSEEHTSELQSHSDLHSFPTRRSSDLALAETLVELLPPILEVVLERPALPCQTEQHIARVHGVGEDGLHHRLLQRVDPGARARVAPLLERMQIREIGRAHV